MIKDELDELEDVIAKSKDRDLELYEGQIRTLLEEEITGRYYYERGAIESTFDADPDLRAAVEVLNNPERMNKILGK
jgi:carboxyl-terminal processing protease